MNKKILVIWTIILIIIFISNIFIFGNKYDYKIYYYKEFNKEDIKISYEKSNIVECKDITYDDNMIIINFAAKNKGATNIDISIGDSSYSTELFVHNFNIITEGGQIGNFNGTYLLEIEFAIFLILVLCYCVKDIKDEVETTRYSYSIINKFGIIIFIVFNLVRVLLNIIFSHNADFMNIYANIINSFSLFSIIGFPFVFIFSVYLIISNIALIRKEGKSLTNFLGIIIGLLLIIGTALSNYMNDLLSNVMNTRSYFGFHVSQFIETLDSILLCYLECLMCSTIICTVKMGKNKPKYDKDFVIILGSGIKKDGTLTPLLKGRADRAIEFAQNQEKENGKKIVFVPSGGKWKDEIISEAEAMKNYLISKGIKEKDILIENKSTNTLENMKFSKIFKEKNTF